MWIWLLVAYLAGMSVTLALMERERERGRLAVTRAWLLVLAGWPVVWAGLMLAEAMGWRDGK